jgi:hypothetical protein
MSTTSPDETTSHVSSIRSPDQTGPARPHLHLFEPSRFVLARRGFRIAPESDPSHESRIQVHCRFTLALPDRVPYELTMLALRTPAFRDFARRQYEMYRQVATNLAGPLLDDIDPRLPGGADAVIQLVTALFDGLTLAWMADPDGAKPDAVFERLEALFVPFYPAAMTSDPPRAS